MCTRSAVMTDLRLLKKATCSGQAARQPGLHRCYCSRNFTLKPSSLRSRRTHSISDHSIAHCASIQVHQQRICRNVTPRNTRDQLS